MKHYFLKDKSPQEIKEKNGNILLFLLGWFINVNNRETMKKIHDVVMGERRLKVHLKWTGILYYARPVE